MLSYNYDAGAKSNHVQKSLFCEKIKQCRVIQAGPADVTDSEAPYHKRAFALAIPVSYSLI